MLTGAAGQAVLQFVVVITLARLLTPYEFGLVGAASVVIGFSRIFSQFGVGPAIVQLPQIRESTLGVAFTLSLVLSVGVALLIFVSTPVFVSLFRMPELGPIIQALTLLFPISGIALVAQALLERDLRFRRLAMIGGLSYGLGYGAVGVACAALGLGVWSLVFAQLAQAILNSALLLGAQRRTVRLGFDLSEARALGTFGTGFSLSTVANYLALQADNLVVGRWLGAQALGVYGRAYQFMVMPASLTGGVIDKVLFPAMATVQDQPERLGRAFRRSMAGTALIVLPLSGMLIVLAPELVLVLLGEDWSEVTPPFRVLAIALFFRTGYKMSDSLVRAKGAVFETAWRKWIYAITVTGGALVGQQWGLIGVAAGVSAAIVVHFALMWQMSRRLLGWRGLGGLRESLWYVAAGASVAGLSAVAATVTRGWGLPDLLVLIATGSVGCAAFVILLRWFAPVLGDDAVWVRERAGLLIKRLSESTHSRARN